MQFFFDNSESVDFEINAKVGCYAIPCQSIIYYMLWCKINCALFIRNSIRKFFLFKLYYFQTLCTTSFSFFFYITGWFAQFGIQADEKVEYVDTSACSLIQSNNCFLILTTKNFRKYSFEESFFGSFIFCTKL